MMPSCILIPSHYLGRKTNLDRGIYIGKHSYQSSEQYWSSCVERIYSIVDVQLITLGLIMSL